MNTAIVTSKAEDCIDQIISSQLLRTLKLAPQQQPRLLEISRQVRVALLGNKEAIASLQVLVPRLDQDQKEWLTTAQAADLVGFSRPYMTALLDSKDFAGKVQKSTGGHRRVLASDVRDWMGRNGVNYPLTKDDLESLNAPVPAEFFEGSEISAQEEAIRMEEIERANRESMQYRPR